MFYRFRYRLAQLVAMAICEPKLRLGKRRHDNYCDECGEHCGRYFADKLDFPLASLEPDDSTKREKLRAMWNAEYTRACLECSVKLESNGGDADADV